MARVSASVLLLLASSCVARDGILDSLDDSLQHLRAFYINRDFYQERRQHMDDQAARAGLSLTRYPAADVDRIASGEFDEKYILAQGLHPEIVNRSLVRDNHSTNSTVGCYISHVTLLEKIQKELTDAPFALILEDDVDIPTNWKSFMKSTIACAPEGWTLLKMSGWGTARDEDLVSTTHNQLAEEDDLLEEQAHKGEMFPWIKHQAMKLYRWVRPASGCPYVFHMKLPFVEKYATPGPDTFSDGRKFFYSGSGGYLVRVKSLPLLLEHLKKQPINDMDAMLLSDGSLAAYESWPHVFDLNDDHQKHLDKDAAILSSSAASARKKDVGREALVDMSISPRAQLLMRQQNSDRAGRLELDSVEGSS